ncbi:hypothetical protein [Mesorhizobium sp. M0323]|uniref:hypothetical protein n=1 Tax=Mesorhizobium sp. M0323 TaxID=2956938 RepID=UPI00333B00E4
MAVAKSCLAEAEAKMRADLKAEKSNASACDPATNAAAVKEARSGLDKVNKFIAQIKVLGLPVPPTLSGAVLTMTRAASAGVDLGEAAGQVDYEVQQVVNNKLKLCSGLPEEDVGECEARVVRQWQARSVEGTLEWSNTHSVFRRAVDKWTGNHCPNK